MLLYYGLRHVYGILLIIIRVKYLDYLRRVPHLLLAAPVNIGCFETSDDVPDEKGQVRSFVASLVEVDEGIRNSDPVSSSWPPPPPTEVAIHPIPVAHYEGGS